MARRPDHVKAPAYLSKSPPLPASGGGAAAAGETAQPIARPDDSPDPTRYGDWTLNGIAVDF